MEVPRNDPGVASVSVGGPTPNQGFAPTIINVQSQQDGQSGFTDNTMDMSARMKQIESDMRRMQEHVQAQFRNFPMAPPTMPEGFMAPPSLIPMDITHPLQPQTMGRPLTPTMQMGRPLTPTMQMTQGRPLTPTLNPDLSQQSPVIPAHNMDTISRTLDGKGKKQLKLQFDMQEFKPDEIQVKAQKNKLEVHAQHEEKEPNRVACRVFHQQYSLPKDVKLTKMQYKVTPEGVLDVEGAVKPQYRVKFAAEDNIQPYK